MGEELQVKSRRYRARRRGVRRGTELEIKVRTAMNAVGRGWC